jgi:hypothetical protein
MTIEMDTKNCNTIHKFGLLTSAKHNVNNVLLGRLRNQYCHVCFVFIGLSVCLFGTLSHVYVIVNRFRNTLSFRM